MQNRLIALGALLVMFFTCGALQAQVNVTTQRYDGFRTSSNLKETILNPSTVKPATFGKLWSYQVEGNVFAQPLYVSNVNVTGVGVRNVVYIATMHDVVYAFDADRPGAPLWQKDLRSPTLGVTEYKSAHFKSQAWITPVGDAFGILSTPVIDLTTNLMYVVAETTEPAGEAYRLHAFDIRSGAEPKAATLIQATSQGIVFDAGQHCQRPGLVLANGQIYIAFGGRPNDDNPYHGWMMTYNASTLAQTGVFIVNATSDGGAIWQGGGAPAVDENGFVYAVSGNGFGGGDGVNNLSESLIKFSFAGGRLAAVDSFTASNNVALDAADYDLGTTNPLVVPGKGLIAFGSKTADFYVANSSNLGKLTANNSGLVQFSHVGTGYTTQYGQSNVMIGLAMWPKAQGPLLYGWPAKDKLFSFTLTGNQFMQTGSSSILAYGGPGAGMALSANGSQAGSGILWASMALDTGGYAIPAPGVLRAFNAEDLSTVLWDSNMNAAQDGISSVAKFNVPTVANGRVYTATFEGLVHVYGLLSTKDFSLATNPSSVTVSQGASGSSTATVSSSGGFANTVGYSASGAPAGMTISFTPASTTAPGQTTIGVRAAATVAGGTYPIVITGTSGSLSHTAILSVTVPTRTAPSASLTSPANNATFTAGANITITAQAAASGATVARVDFLRGATMLGSATAAPYSFTWTNVPAGAYQLTAKVTDSMGGTATSTPVNITVSSPVAGNPSTMVNLSAAANVYGIFSDGTPVSNGGMTYSSYAYSANGLGSSANWAGAAFTLGAANTRNAVTSATLPLPAGNYTSLRFLATGDYGNQLNQSFTVNYTDGTATTLVQNLSDWGYPQNWAGETTVISEPHRVMPSGATQNGPWYLYGYTILLNSAKTVKSFTLPNNASVIVFAVSLTPPVGLRFVPLTPCRAVDTRNASSALGGPMVSANAPRSFALAGVCGVPSGAQAYSLNLTVIPAANLQAIYAWASGEAQPNTPILGSDGRIKAQAAIVPASAAGAITVNATDNTHVAIDVNGYFVPASNPAGLAFYPLTPCRAYDTRISGSGAPALAGGQARVFAMRSAVCGIPASAQAYSVNLTVVPRGTLWFLNAAGTGQNAAGASTLSANSGAITANAAIVPGGWDGGIAVYASQATDLIIDVNGYFAPPAAGSLSYYPVTPCRAYSTTAPVNSTFAAPIAGACGVPSSAKAYVLDATVTPSGSFGYLSLWANGAAQPTVSTLNAVDAAVTSNQAIVSNTNGLINAFTTGAGRLILDVSGYFAP